MTGRKQDSEQAERIGDLLHGLRRTLPRIAVLQVLEPAGGHISVAEIHQRLMDSVPAGTHPPDLAAVYRTVTTLVELGVLHPLTLESGITTCGLTGAPHHHAVCIRCGAVSKSRQDVSRQR